MTIPLAISDTALAGADLPAVVQQVKRSGFDGLEIRGVAHGRMFGSHRLLADPGRTHRALEDAGLRVAALLADVVLCDGRGRVNAGARETLHGHLITAAELGAPVLCVRPTARRLPLHRLPEVALAIEGLLARAGELGVKVVVQNEGGAFGARDLWRLGQLLPSRAWGFCWDSQAHCVDTPAIAVPLLGTRLEYVRLRAVGAPLAGAADGQATAGINKVAGGAVNRVEGRTESPVEGSVEGPGPPENLVARQFILRLRGIGYGGWISHVPGGETDAATLAMAAALLRQWMNANRTDHHANVKGKPTATPAAT